MSSKRDKVCVDRSALVYAVEALARLSDGAESMQEDETEELLTQLRSIVEQAIRVHYDAKRAVSISETGDDLARFKYKDDLRATLENPFQALARLRLELQQTSEVLSQILPARRGQSSGGRKRMSIPEGIGDQIRADADRMTTAEVYQKWCMSKEYDPKAGVEGGRGRFAMPQVRSALAHRRPKHR